MKRLKMGFVSLAVACSLIATPVFAQPISDLESQQKEAEQKKKNAEAEASSLQTELTKVLTKVSELEEQLVSKGEEIQQANEDLEAAQAKEEKQYDDMVLRIKYMYEQGDTAMLEKLFQSGSISEFLTQAEYFQNLHTYDREMLKEYADTKEEIANLKVTLEEEMANLEELQDEFESQKASLSRTLENKKDEIEDLDAEVQAAATAVAKAKEEEARRQAEAEEAARQQANNNSNNSNSNNSGNSSNNTGNNNNKPNTPSTPPSGGNNSGSNAGSGNSSTGAAIVSAAYSYIGVPYVWGGTSYSGIDCSGLTMQAHRAAGISIPRTSGAQAGSGKNVGSLSNALPGDVICYPGHVAIYIGGGQVIHAPTTGQTVKVASVSMGASQPITAIRRYW